MKIAFIINWYSISGGGGIETHVTNLRKALEEQGHEVYLIVKRLFYTDVTPELLNDDHIFVRKGIDHHNKHINGLYSNKRLLAKLKELNLDIIHDHHYSHKLVKCLKKHLNIKIVHTCHFCMFANILQFCSKKFRRLKIEYKPENEAKINKLINKYYFLFGYQFKKSKNLYDLGISISHFSDLYYPMMIPSDKIRKIPNPIDFDKYNNADLNVVTKLKEELQIKDNDTVFLNHSRLHKSKRTYELINDFGTIKSENVKLIVCGKFLNKSYKRKVLRLIKRLGIEDRIHFVGLVNHDQLKNYFALADIGIYYSYAECQWVSYLEFLATNKPVIINQHDSIVGVIEEEVNGFIANNTEEFMRAANLLMTDQVLYNSMCKEIRPTIETFNTENYIDKLINFYKEAIAL